MLKVLKMMCLHAHGSNSMKNKYQREVKPQLFFCCSSSVLHDVFKSA